MAIAMGDAVVGTVLVYALLHSMLIRKYPGAKGTWGVGGIIAVFLGAFMIAGMPTFGAGPDSIGTW